MYDGRVLPAGLLDTVLSPLRSLNNGRLAALAYACIVLGGCEMALDLIGRPVDTVIRDAFRVALGLLLATLGASHALKPTGVNVDTETSPTAAPGGAERAFPPGRLAGPGTPE